MPGQRLAFSQPIEMRMNEMISGVAADVAVKLFGDDLDVLVAKGEEIEAILQADSRQRRRERRAGHRPAGAADQARTRTQLARYGVPAKVGDRPRRIDRQQAAGRSDRRPVAVPAGGAAAGDNAQRRRRRSARSWCRRRPASGCRCRGWPTFSMVEGPVDDHARMGPAADHRLGQRPRPRPGQLRRRGPAADEARSCSCRRAATSIECGGQFEHLQRARTRLLIVVPLALVLIFALLYLTYHNVVDALRVFTGVPFGWVGGIFALWLRDMPFSISAAIGFIALSGVAVLDDMILVSYVRQLRQQGHAARRGRRWKRPSRGCGRC